MAEQLLSTVLADFIPHVTSLTINASDITRRKRHTAMIEKQISAAYNSLSIAVNIAIWNMHLNEDHSFQNILDSGIQKMGNGGGFRLVVFKGGGYLRNNRVRGFETWCCIGNQYQQDNVITFNPC